MKFEMTMGILNLISAIASIIGVAVFWNSPDVGFIRYGVILPIWFIYNGIVCLNKAGKLKKEAQNANTKHTQGN